MTLDPYMLELYVRIAILIVGHRRLGRWPRIEGDGWLAGRLDDTGRNVKG